MAETYTIADLCALPNDALDAMAVELRGWHWIESDLVDESGEVQVMWPVCFTPTTNHNQSGKLLSHAVSNGCAFEINIGDEPFVEFTWPDAPEALTSRNGADWREIPGNDARTETIVFCAAMLAMAGRLKEGK
jgi:hypothetical protein